MAKAIEVKDFGGSQHRLPHCGVKHQKSIWFVGNVNISSVKGFTHLSAKIDSRKLGVRHVTKLTMFQL